MGQHLIPLKERENVFPQQNTTVWLLKFLPVWLHSVSPSGTTSYSTSTQLKLKNWGWLWSPLLLLTSFYQTLLSFCHITLEFHKKISSFLICMWLLFIKKFSYLFCRMRCVEQMDRSDVFPARQRGIQGIARICISCPRWWCTVWLCSVI